MSRVLVLGGKGFIGRHAVKHLQAAGAQVTIGTRHIADSNPFPQHKLVLHKLCAKEAWQDTVDRFDVILNCVGILRQRWGESYEAVHHLAPAAIACACAGTETKFVHVSALGLSATAKSRFLTSKIRGEQAILNSNAQVAVVRLSLLDGDGGYGAAWLRGVSQLPFFVVPTSAQGKIAALTADDAGEALSNLCLGHVPDGVDGGSVFELGGQSQYSFRKYIEGLRARYTHKPAVCLKVPGMLARFGAHICDVLHFSPFSFGHWELLCKDNVPAHNQLPELLGRAPQEVISLRSED